MTANRRVRIRVIAADGTNRGGLLDVTGFSDYPQWVGDVINGAREVLFQVPHELPGTHVWYLVQQALDPVLDDCGPEEAIDLASTARKLTEEEAGLWFDGKPFALPPSLAPARSSAGSGDSAGKAQRKPWHARWSQALDIVTKNPDWSNARIAKEMDISPSSLSRDPIKMVLSRARKGNRRAP